MSYYIIGSLRFLRFSMQSLMKEISLECVYVEYYAAIR